MQNFPPDEVVPQHSRYVRSGGTANTFCFYSSAPLMPYSLTSLPENCMGYHRTSIDLHVDQ
ncbi:hypothetical protein T11_1495 [Trichinella zimbabwensis]|uniref:Uncharacterized protein n=1 Tax=Trichinella zimbabwensis TaxID=268475 RepID=A0A0V1HR95_9BILA|nr:hypothetical protein T11_6436 [Trichinella zimbabwensis]KRZ12724.1 hypothetical protein T11_1495 [Trichinella zimbabwensis]